MKTLRHDHAGAVGRPRSGRLARHRVTAPGPRLTTGILLCTLCLAIWPSRANAVPQPQERNDERARAAPSATDPKGDDPYSANQRTLMRRVLREGKRARAANLLLEMVANERHIRPVLNHDIWRTLARSRELAVHHRNFARRRLALTLGREGKPEEASEALRALGYLDRFRVIGPFDNEGKLGLDRTLPFEGARREALDLGQSHPGRERAVLWREVPDIVRGGYVSLDALFRPRKNVCAVAETSVELPTARTLTLWLGAGGAVKLYFNGAPVFEDRAYRRPHPDRHVVRVRGQAGKNLVQLKVCTRDRSWGFYLRAGDARGEGLQLPQDPDHNASTVPPRYQPPQSKLPLAPLAGLEELAARRGARAAAIEDLARWLHGSGADDPAEGLAAQYADRAAELEPTTERMLLAARLARHRHERMAWTARALQRSPGNAKVLLARASALRAGPAPERALVLLENIPEQGVTGLSAIWQRARTLRDLGLHESSLQLIGQARARATHSRPWMLRHARALDRVGRNDEAIAIHHLLAQLAADELVAQRRLVQDAIAQGREEDALARLNLLASLAPGKEQRMFYVARQYDALQRSDLQLMALRRALATAPQSARAHTRLGKALLTSKQMTLATEAFREALALRPQDAETRELLEQLSATERLDESFAIDREQLLARRHQDQTHPFVWLQDLTVNSVYENGLSSRFVQLGAQVMDAEGARRLRSQSVPFSPDTQRVVVRRARIYRPAGDGFRVLEATESYENQLGEPWYRIYYDTRALVVVFPDLEPGDVVEFRYRVDDIATSNMFADYYGDLRSLQDTVPRTNLEYVLLSPPTRSFYFNEPKLPGLRRESGSRGDFRMDRFVATDVPGLLTEPGMPGITEVAPYLHVSTYRDWQQVGRWYWGLVQDQLYADARLKKTVRKLVKGSRNNREIVERIHGWVLRETRYVALEFGIHGYLPYRVPTIVRRGFGDCKDKASLIYTMLREAGVEARIVLVRTRRNGAINDLPASLAVFDHAIAYVPEFEMFLDGTAEHSGTQELPGADQGVTSLVIGPDSVRLQQIPVSKATQNERSRALDLHLSASGDARIKVEEQVQGVEAPPYRARYQAVGLRAERLEAQLANSYPGLTLENHSFEQLDALEKPVKLRYELRAPQLAKVEGDGLRMAPSLMSDLLRALARSPERRLPLELGVPRSYREQRRITLPLGMRVASLPPGGEVASPFGKLELRFARENDKLVASTHFELSTDRVAAIDYPAFRSWVEAADTLLRQRISITPETAAPETTAPETAAPETTAPETTEAPQ